MHRYSVRSYSFRYLRTVEELQRVELQGMPREEKLAFFRPRQEESSRPAKRVLPILCSLRTIEHPQLFQVSEACNLAHKVYLSELVQAIQDLDALRK